MYVEGGGLAVVWGIIFWRFSGGQGLCPGETKIRLIFTITSPPTNNSLKILPIHQGGRT